MGEVGVFMRAATTSKKTEMDGNLWLMWNATHGDHKSISALSKKILGSTKRHNQKEIQSDWNKLKQTLGGLK